MSDHSEHVEMRDVWITIDVSDTEAYCVGIQYFVSFIDGKPYGVEFDNVFKVLDPDGHECLDEMEHIEAKALEIFESIKYSITGIDIDEHLHKRGASRL